MAFPSVGLTLSTHMPIAVQEMHRRNADSTYGLNESGMRIASVDVQRLCCPPRCSLGIGMHGC